MQEEQISNDVEQAVAAEEQIFSIAEQIEYIEHEIKIKEEFAELVKDANPEEIATAKKDVALMKAVMHTLSLFLMVKALTNEEEDFLLPQLEEAQC
jgi:adenine-specific DNA methylase